MSKTKPIPKLKGNEMPMQSNLQQILDRHVAEIRARSELTPTAKRARIAHVFKPLKAEADLRYRTAKEQRAATVSKARQEAFGVSHLATTPGDRAMVSMARRQADEKVATVETAADAAKLLQHAIDSGDPTMAIAIREHAFTQSNFALADPEWAQVTNASVQNDSRAFAAVEVLLADRRKSPISFENVLVAPSELGNAAPYEVERFIAEDPSVEAGVSS